MERSSNHLQKSDNLSRFSNCCKFACKLNLKTHSQLNSFSCKYKFGNTFIILSHLYARHMNAGEVEKVIDCLKGEAIIGRLTHHLRWTNLQSETIARDWRSSPRVHFACTVKQFTWERSRVSWILTKRSQSLTVKRQLKLRVEFELKTDLGQLYQFGLTL